MKLLADSAKEEQGLMRQLVDEFAANFLKQHGLTLRFTDRRPNGSWTRPFEPRSRCAICAPRGSRISSLA
jgi:hypothetical protein